MFYKEYIPSKTLEKYVKCYYTLEYERGVLVEDQAFATGCVEVMFTLHGAQWQTKQNGLFTKTSSVELWGQILKPLSFRASGPSKVFGIRFYPATASFLLREDVSRLNDGVVEMSTVLGNSICYLHEQLQEAPSINNQIDQVEKYLSKRLLANPKVIEKISLVQEVMNEMTREDFFDNISNVAARYGITSRYLQKIFVQYTGLTPKLSLKINRFQNSLVLLGKKDLSLIDIAYKCGYFDQSHFIREFKSFTGFAPSNFATENSTAILASPNKIIQ